MTSTANRSAVEERLDLIRKEVAEAKRQAPIDAGKALDALRRAAGEHGEVAARAAIRALAALRGVDMPAGDCGQLGSLAVAEESALVPRLESPEIAAGVSKRMNATITLALKVEAGTLTPAVARLALAAGGYGPEVVARIDALEVGPAEPMLLLAAECIQRLADEAGEDETIAQVLDRLMGEDGAARDPLARSLARFVSSDAEPLDFPWVIAGHAFDVALMVLQLPGESHERLNWRVGSARDSLGGDVPVTAEGAAQLDHALWAGLVAYEADATEGPSS